MKLEQIYKEILDEVGKLNTSRAYPFSRKSGNVTKQEANGKTYPSGYEEYYFTIPGNTKYKTSKFDPVSTKFIDRDTQIQVNIEYRMGLKSSSIPYVRVDFDVVGRSAGVNPIVGDDYKSLYDIMNTVGAVLVSSLKSVGDLGTVESIVIVGKKELGKKDENQRQRIYNLFVSKNFPGGEWSSNQDFEAGAQYILPKNYKNIINSLEEVYTEIRLNEVGEGTSEPFKYKKNFERGKSFGYIIDGYVKSTNNKPDLEVPIKLQGLDYDQDIEDLEPDFIEFLSADGSNPEGTLNGIEVIFSHADRDTFALVNDVKFMFRLMATIKQILQKEFSSSMPDVLLYSPTKEGSEAIEDTGRHRLYKAFIQKAFPSARMFVDDRGEEIIFKLK